ncbi:MAG: AAA family ATPase [Bacteroidota bacterium]
MNSLIANSEILKRRTNLDFIRPIYDRVDWNGNLTAILGARGVGKTTLLLQRLVALDLPPNEALYLDMGDLYFQEHRLSVFIADFVARGGRFLLIDEVHRYGYQTWAQELKQAYDLYRGKLSIVFTGSSAVQILRQKADLSRRVLQVRVPGLSFREYLKLEHSLEMSSISLQDIFLDHRSIVNELLSIPDFRPIQLLHQYWREGYYPFFLSDRTGYLSRVNTMVQLVLEADLPAVIETGRVDYQKIGRLLYAIASSTPFKPNISKLSSRLGMARETILVYLKLLARADLVFNLQAESKGVAALSKPDKLFLNNCNLLYALAPTQANLGTLRETFFLNQIDYLTHATSFLSPEIRLPGKGDFVLIDKERRYLFEIGGSEKTSRQIGQHDNHFTIIDSEASLAPHKIPLWLFGLLY